MTRIQADRLLLRLQTWLPLRKSWKLLTSPVEVSPLRLHRPRRRKDEGHPSGIGRRQGDVRAEAVQGHRHQRQRAGHNRRSLPTVVDEEAQVLRLLVGKSWQCAERGAGLLTEALIQV